MRLYSKTIQRLVLTSIILLMAGFAVLFNSFETKAQITHMLNFAGKVTNTDGSEVTDGNYDFSFSLYDAATGGTELWTETLDASTRFAATIDSYDSGTYTYTYTGATATSTLRIGQHLSNSTTGESVLITAFDTSANTITVVDGSPTWTAGQAIHTRPYVEGGVIDENLGSVTDLSSVNFNQPLYLEITFNSETMQPRKMITAVAQAFNADKLDGYDASEFANLSADSIVTGSWTFNNNLAIVASSTETALTITQNGSGDIVNFFDSDGTEVFTVTEAGDVGIGISTPTATLDVNGDFRVGNSDLVTGDASQTDNAAFSAGTNSSTAVSGDDVILGTDALVFGDNTYTVQSSFDGPYDVFVADIDGDGDMDMVSAAANTDLLYWYENDGSETFSPHLISNISMDGIDSPRSVYAIDMDGDGDMDVVSGGYSSNTVYWYENDGSENFSSHALTGSVLTVYDVYATDLDDDGDIDVLSAGYSSNNIYWHENDGSENFTLRTVDTGLYYPNSVMAIDLDGDGDKDVLSTNYLGDDVLWHENDGSENFTLHYIDNATINGPRQVDVGDLDGDGDLDIIATSYSDSYVRWYENDGSENFSPSSNISISGAWDLEIVDMDQDGDNDFVVGAYTSGIIYLYSNDGSGNFTPSSVGSVASVAALYVDDIDSDGDNDMAAVSAAGDAVYWLETTGGGYLTSGTFTSSAIDSGDDSPDYTTLDFNITEVVGTTDIQFQLRSASSEAGLSSATWYGPTGVGDYYTSTGTAINSVHDGDQYVQLIAYLTTTDNSQTPTLHDFTINYDYYGGLFTVSDAGVVTSGTWNGGAVGVDYGGTGLSTVTDGYFLVGNDSTTLEATSSIYLSADGYIGLGTTTPSQQLTLTGNLELQNTTNASQYGVIYKGDSTFIHNFNYGDNGTVTTNGLNTFVGESSGNFTMGSGATSAAHASYNTGIGASSLSSLTTGYYNTAMGTYSLNADTSGYYNTAIGTYALQSNTTGAYNTAIGARAMSGGTGNYNAAVGTYSLNLNSSGSYNTAMGIYALGGNSTGSYNAAIGYNAGRYYGTGSTNNAASTYSVYLGQDTRASASGNTNEIVIGSGAVGLGSNTAILGNDSITRTVLQGNVGIGNTSPTVPLYVRKGSFGGTYPSWLEADVMVLENAAGYSTALNLISDDAASSYIAFSTTGTNGAGYISYVPSAYALRFSASGTEPLVVTGDGTVGIGTSTSPEATLHVQKASAGTTRPSWISSDAMILENGGGDSTYLQIMAANDRSSGIYFSDNDSRSSGGITYSHASDLMMFRAGASTRMYINSTGVGIGTSNPSVPLSLQGSAGQAVFNIASSTGDSIFYIDAQGEIGIGTQSPDATVMIAATSTAQLKLAYTGTAHEASFTVDENGTFTIESNEPGDVYIDPTSNFGVGTSSPQAPLTVYGDIFIEGTDRYVNFGGVTGSTGYGIRDNSGTLEIKNSGTSWTPVTLVQSGQVGWVPRYYENSPNLQATSSIFISNAGYVGIGDTSPTSQLSLGGDIDLNSHNMTEIGILDVGSTYGYGLRFNNAGGSSITWGNDSTHQFGGVTISGVKINTGAQDTGTGVTFGPYGEEPTASINSNGTLTLNGFAYVGGARLTLSETTDRASSSILVETSQGIPFLEFATSSGEVYMFVNKDGWLGLNTDTPNTFLHVGSADPDKVSGGENAYVEGSVEIDGVLYVDGVATSSFLGGIDLAGAFSAGADNFYINDSGVVTSGTWQGDVIDVTYGGTGLSSVADGYSLFGTGGTALEATSTLFMADNGYIGIGSTTPGYNLAVTGTFYADDIYTSTSTIYMGGVPILTFSGTQNVLTLYEDQANGGNSLTLIATSTLASDVTYTLPGPGTVGQALILGDNNNLYWGEAGSGSGDVGTGTTGQFPYYSSDGTALTATSSIYISAAGNIGIGTTTATSKLTLDGNLLINGDILPYASSSLGSATQRFTIGYFDEIDVLNGVSAPASANGTDSDSFTLNSDNATADAEDSTLSFERGTVTPNANLTWSATNQRFEMNQALYLATNDLITLGDLSVGTSTILAAVSIQGTAGSDIFNVASSTGTSVFHIDSYGNIGLGTTTPDNLLDIVGNLGIKDQGVIKLYESASNGLESIGFRATSTIASDTVYTWPGAGSVGQALLLGADNNLYWSDVGTGSGSGTVNSGLTGQMAYYAADGDALTATSTMFVDTTGYVGVGTSSPAYRLDVYGNARIDGDLTVNNLSAANITGTWQGDTIDVTYGGTGLSSVANGYTLIGTGGGALEATSTILVTDSGKVGIGTTSPTYNLEVHGTFYADDIYTSTSTIYMGGVPVFTFSGTQNVFTLYEDSDNGANSLTLVATSTLASNITYTLPDAGTIGQVLAYGVDGNLYWTDAGAGGGSGTVGTGTIGQVPYYAADGTTLTATSTITVDASGDLGIANQGALRLYESSANGSNYLALRATSTLASNATYTLPDLGEDGQVLTFGEDGNLRWSEATLSGSVSGEMTVSPLLPASASITQTSYADFYNGTFSDTVAHSSGYVYLGVDPDSVAVGATEHTAFSSSDRAFAVYMIDVDGDGDMDMISASQTDNTVYWAENDGSENFTTYAISTSAIGVSDVFGIDMDGDGDIDVLSASQTDDRVTWYENDGSESFTAHDITTSLDYVYGVEALDMDGDGDIDVLANSFIGGGVYWYENDGSENFTSRQISSLTFTYGVEAGDLDDDGDIDVLITDMINNRLYWYENNGSETFTSNLIISSGLSSPQSVEMVDIDEDGDEDILIANVGSDKVTWHENDGSESFTAHDVYAGPDQLSSVYAVDLDEDGDIDILSGARGDTQVLWYENDGSESFSSNVLSSTVTINNNHSLHYGDMDGDGDIDIAAAGYDADAVYWFESTSAKFTSGSFISTAVNTTQESPEYTTFSFGSTEPSGTDVQFQLRSASTEGGLSSATWYGPTGTSDYYTITDTVINSVHDGDQYIQVKAYLSGDGSDTPFVDDFTINFNYDSPGFVILEAGYVGIGTTTPNMALVIGSDYSSSFSVNEFGQVKSGTWQGNAIGSEYGGTGQDSSTWSGIAMVNSGIWSATSTLSVNYGGTGLTSIDQGYMLIGGAGNTMTATSSIFVSNEGKIGIGTTTPDSKLVVTDETAGSSDNIFKVATSSDVFRITGAGDVYADGSFVDTGADYAEYFYTLDTDLAAGEVVCVDITNNNAVERCTDASDTNVMGIVSTRPAIVGNARSEYMDNSHYVVVGMLGQVPAKVSDENGEIRPGDSLTSAGISGYIMKANPGDSTVGVALEGFGTETASGTPEVVSTGEIKVLISRRNKSLTVDMVESKITDHIAAMEIEDEVEILIANAVDTLDLGDEIQPIVDEQIALFDSRLSVEFDTVTNQLTTFATSIDGISERMSIVENSLTSISSEQDRINDRISEVNEQLILLGAGGNSSLNSILVDSDSGLVITNNQYRDEGEPAVSVVEIVTATTTEKTAFVVNQLGDGDVVDFQADGVSIVNIADDGKVSVVGEMSVDGRLMVCSGAGCGDTLDEAVDETMGDMGVEGKVVAGAFESVCDEGFVWVPGSSKYGTMPGFCVMAGEARVGEDGIPTTELEVEGHDSSIWVNVSQGEAQLACQAMGDNYHLITENEWLTIAENVIRVGENDIDADKLGLQLATSSPETSVYFTLSNGNQVYDLVGSVREWTDMVVTKAGLIQPTSEDWQEYYDIVDFRGFNIAPPYYYDSSNGIGRIKVSDNENSLRGFVRGETSLYDLDLSDAPTTVDENIGFRCSK